MCHVLTCPHIGIGMDTGSDTTDLGMHGRNVGWVNTDLSQQRMAVMQELWQKSCITYPLLSAVVAPDAQPDLGKPPPGSTP